LGTAARALPIRHATGKQTDNSKPYCRTVPTHQFTLQLEQSLIHLPGRYTYLSMSSRHRSYISLTQFVP
jgi:hypothetical protein